jgi:hypothetical protein
MMSSSFGEWFYVVGLTHLIANAFGGRGTFLTYCYSYLLYGVPLGTVSLILSMIPFVNYLSILVSIYHIVLQVFMTMGVHRLSGGRATLAVLILPIVVVVLSCVAIEKVFLWFLLWRTIQQAM